MSNRQEKPFTSLGNHLKYVREQAKQSLAEVSGAVEIDEQYLERIEAGVERPAEDILLLLISHFGVKDREAVQLWESAEYDNDMPDDIKPVEEQIVLGNKSVLMVMAVDNRTSYTDDITVIANSSGLTLQFGQTQGKAKANPVASLGMSHEQAEIVIKAMQSALLHSKYNGHTKLLPPPSTPEA
jgi:transcriptional regulator with XRE-family HTH domain